MRKTTTVHIGDGITGTEAPPAILGRTPARGGTSSMWTRTIVMLMTVVLALGVVSYLSTAYQRRAFAETTTRFEDEVTSVVELVRGLRSIDVPMGSIFYELGSPAELKDQVRVFDERAGQIDASFDRAQRMLPATTGTDPLASARAAWEATVEDVEAAQKLWGTAHVSDALAAGKDPYSETWQRLRDAQGNLTELTAASLAHLREHRRAVDRIQGLIPPIVLGSLALTLVIGAVSARRLSRRIVAPVLRLRDAAMRMRDGDLETTVEIDKVDGELRDLASAMNDMAGSLRASQGRLRRQASTDALTGLPNRKALIEHLRRRTDVEPPDGLAVLFIDLDDFKVVNDSLGHAAGDSLLRIVADRLRSSARGSELVSRLGGDEFAVVVDAGGDPTAATSVAERILEALSEPVALERDRVTTGCSIGIALAVPGFGSTDELIRNADIAMYMAKSRGKHCVEMFAPTMHSEMLSRMALKADLALATELDQLELHYQPVVDLGTLDILGWEALVRWRHPERGLIPPAQFIPLAEDTRDILAIGQWVLQRACADHAATLQDAGTPGCWVSVNVSGHQLSQPGFVGVVQDALARHGLRPESLVLEITEATLVTDTRVAAEALTTLQRAGVRVAVDDFGTGFSSLRYLQDLPVDIIKIDRSFISDDGDPEAPNDVLAAILALGGSLGLDMIAEGIERASELERLQGAGQVAGQGYLIAHPMQIDEAVSHAQAHLSGCSAGTGQASKSAFSTLRTSSRSVSNSRAISR